MSFEQIKMEKGYVSSVKESFIGAKNCTQMRVLNLTQYEPFSMILITHNENLKSLDSPNNFLYCKISTNKCFSVY